MLWKEIDEVRRFYSVDEVLEHRIKLATEGFAGKLITHNFKKIASLLSPYKVGEKVLDVGSGWGFLSCFLPKHIEHYALDVSLQALTISRGLYEGTERLASDACLTPFRDNTFDKVFCINLITHLPIMEEGLAEIYRITKPSGLCVINFLNMFGLTTFLKTIFGLRIGYYGRHNLFAPIDKSCNLWEMKKLLEKTGFKILGNFGWGISVPYALGQKIPNLAIKMTDYVIRVQDSFPVKHLSNAFVFKVKKIEM